MRPWPAVLLVLLLPFAAAQDEDPATNCTEADPCLWTLNIGDEGFSSPGSFEGPSFNGTQGDWVRLELLSDAGEAHTIAFDLNNGTWEVAPYGETLSEPLLLAEAGSFAIRDAPTGDEVPVQVFLSDASEEGDPITAVPTPANGASSPATDGEDGPAAGLVFITLGVFAILAAMRRR